VAVANNLAYVADGGTGLIVADITDPTQPRQLAVFDTPWYAQGVAVQDDVIYVADGQNGLLVFSLTPATAAMRIRISWTGGPLPWMLELGDPDGIAWPEEVLAGLRVEQSTNLIDWFLLNSDRLWTNGRVQVADPDYPGPSSRFYRAIHQ
jgi:hypothetical protein